MKRPGNKKIIYQDTSIFYNVSGKGRPVVLIHGVPADSSLWDHQVNFLSDKYQLIVPDLPGSGKSELINDMSIVGMAETIKAILDAEKISQAVLIGHSMGGYVSIAFADKYPGMLTALGLFHSSAYADGEDKKAARQKNISFIQRQGSFEFIKQSTPGLFCDAFRHKHKEIVAAIIEKYRSFNPDSLAAYQQAMMERSDRRGLLEQIVKPVMFIIGEHDKAIPFADSMQQCHLPALSYIHILKNSGHMGMLEEVDKSNTILENFLKDIEG